MQAVYHFWYNKTMNKEERREYNKKWVKENPEYHKKYQRKHYSEHSEELKERSRKWRKENPEKMKEYNKKWKEENKEENKEYHKKYHKDRRQTDPHFRIISNLRSRQNRAIKTNQKTGSTIDYLGCSIEYFKKYIADQFTEGMSWDNYGHKTWNIDHQIPLSVIDPMDEEDLRHVLHFTNLQPMWAKDNIRKGNKI